MMTYWRFLLFSIVYFSFSTLPAQTTGTVRGRVTDHETGDPLPGAAVLAGSHGTAADMDGQYTLTLPAGHSYTLVFSYISYRPLTVAGISVQAGALTEVPAALVPDEASLNEVRVTAERRHNTDRAMLSSIKAAPVMVSGISSQTIARTQDRDAAEVVKRIPGIAIIDGRFVVIRGLAQRYNNAWINGMALPSSEADSRAFSFDIIPGSQIDNMMIVKTPAAEYPADYAGGFVLVNTKAIAPGNSLQVSYGTGVHSETHFRDFTHAAGSGTDFLGFDNGFRALKNVPARMNNDPGNRAEIDRVSKTGFNNNWVLKTAAPLPDQRLNMALNRQYASPRRGTLGMALTLTYSHANKTVRDMENAQFGVYSITSDRPEYLFRYTDNLYTQDVRLGGMAHFSFVPRTRGDNVHRYTFSHIFNQLGRSRYTLREGWRNVSALYEQLQEEYAYQSRTTYSGQLAGSHLFGHGANDLQWNIGYAYSNRYQPDRRIVERRKDPSNGVYDYAVNQNDISRYFTALDEHVVSGAVNYLRKIALPHSQVVELKAGLYATRTAREYRTRNFIYVWDMDNRLPAGFASLPTDRLLAPENIGAPDKLYVRDETDNTDNYAAAKTLLAGYATLHLPFHRFAFYAGLRFEHCATAMTAYTQIATEKHRRDYFTANNLFPSVNLTYNLSAQWLLRAAYGISVNRQEFRELTPSTYYDFDLFSRLSGNPALKQALIHNADLRVELYPGGEDVVSAAFFLKRFLNPIELMFFDTGGGVVQYSYDNALRATNYGLEVDARKQLGFLGLPQLTVTLNLALIHSQVHFAEGSHSHDRPMQGQSPYLINAGVFYQTPGGRFQGGVFYNRIGERIIGLGRIGGDSINNDIPDLYERSRHTIDLTFALRLGHRLELRGAVRDLLAEPVEWVQYPRFTDAGGAVQKRTQTTRRYCPGRNILLSLAASF
jgi:TonB-dependent receptor